MEKINKLFNILLIIHLTTISSCSCTNNETALINESQVIFNQYLYLVIDSITAKYNLDQKILVHYDMYPDNVKHNMINGLISFVGKEENKKTLLLKELVKILDDSVQLNILEKSFDTYVFYYKPESIVENVDFDSNDFFGTVNLTNIVFNKKMNFACHYIAIQCGTKCGNGNIVFYSKNNSNWHIFEIIEIWN